MSQIDLSLFSFDLSPDLRIPQLPEISISTKNGQNSGPRKNKISLSKAKSSYTKIIHDLAENPLTDEFISWTKDGKFLYVHDAAMLCEELERGNYFRSSKFASFVRNLNYHCFRKLRFDELDRELREELDRKSHSNGTRHLFYHPFFQRGRDDLLHMIKSQKTDSDKKDFTSISTQESSAKLNTSDTLDIRLDFARKEGDFLNIISSKDAAIAQKDEEIATLRALLNDQENINKRKLPSIPSCDSQSKKQRSLNDDESYDYDVLFDDLDKHGYFDDDLPDMIEI